jgi:glutathione synthase/RimK-type ligase-like ATP-grasp enzyme
LDSPVLLLTHSGDYYTIDLVEAALRERGAHPLRVDTDLFPTQLALSADFAPTSHTLSLRVGDERVALDEVRAVWSRRLWPGRPAENLDPRFAQHVRRESRTAFLDTLALLEDAHWVNPIGAMMRAESKLLQLKRAQEVGFALPETVIGNEPEAARALYAQTGGRMVTKLLGALSQTMNATGEFVYTNVVTDDDMAAIEQVRQCPQIFQRLIQKRHELRVIVVGRRCFTGAIDTSDTERGQVDWRRTEAGSGVRWREVALPDDVETRLFALMDRLELRYGAADFIVDTEGRHVFLEVNPAGEWGWLQRDLEMPIAEAIADELLAGVTATDEATESEES